MPMFFLRVDINEGICLLRVMATEFEVYFVEEVCV